MCCSVRDVLKKLYTDEPVTSPNTIYHSTGNWYISVYASAYDYNIEEEKKRISK